MRNYLYLAVFVAACGGTDASISGVFPAEAFTGRSVRVQVSGDATEWSNSATVDFGPGVTVSSVNVAGPTTIFADVVISDSAAIGPRDVSVHGGGGHLVLADAFVLESPISFQFQGLAAQGGLPYFTMVNRDFDNPWDTTEDDQGGFVNLDIVTPPGITFAYQSTGDYKITGYAFIDVDAVPGPLTINAGGTGNQLKSSLGADLDIQARTPTALVDGTTGTLMNVGDSALYSIDASAVPALVRTSLSTSSSSGSPVTAILGPTGHWTDVVGGRYGVAETAGTVYVVVFDAGTASGYNFTISGKSEQLTRAVEGNDTNNNSNAGALNATLPFEQTTGVLSSASDNDLIKFTVSAADANKRIRVIAESSDGNTDTQVEVHDGGSGTPTSFTGGPVNDGGCFPFFGLSCGEDVLSDPLPAGTYYIEITAGADYDVSAKNYTVLTWLE